jgi:hypothetical protein
VTEGRTYWYLPQTSSVYPTVSPQNVRIDVEARRIEGSDADAGYGIACRADRNDNAYTFTLSAAGNYVIIAKFVDGVWHPMDEEQISGVDENASLGAGWRRAADCTAQVLCGR